MAYDEHLEQRIRGLLKELLGVIGKKMFGGICFMIHGNMACGVHKDNLIVRIGSEQQQEALAQSHTKVFDITGRPMKNWILVTPDGIQSDADLKRWVAQGLDFALTLPPK